MVAARQFNKVMVINDTVVKSGQRSILEGEIFFYRHVPPDVADLFPALRSWTVEDLPQACTMEMERVAGVTFTHMLVNRCITRHRLTIMLHALRRIHSSPGVPEATVGEDSIYENYAAKVDARYKTHRTIYHGLLRPEEFHIVHKILDFLRSYERGRRGVLTKVLHGDPVFSNILLNNENQIYFLDMRGCLGKLLTTVGDVVYDLAKVYQSLCGYDYFLLDQPVLNSDQVILTDLKSCFEEFVTEHYPDVSMDNVKMVTASHFFSLIPLHTEAPVDRKILFWQQCKGCITMN